MDSSAPVNWPSNSRSKLLSDCGWRGILFVLLTGLAFLGSTGCYYFVYSSEWAYSGNLRDAERYAREKEYDNAISSYQDHIEDRLAAQDRPDAENPFFYYLIIGDLELDRQNVEAALEAYEHAEEKGVEPGLVSDRYRFVANWYERREEFDKAIDILTRYGDRDPLLFDLMRDRIARESVAHENSSSESK